MKTQKYYTVLKFLLVPFILMASWHVNAEGFRFSIARDSSFNTVSNTQIANGEVIPVCFYSQPLLSEGGGSENPNYTVCVTLSNGLQIGGVSSGFLDPGLNASNISYTLTFNVPMTFTQFQIGEFTNLSDSANYVFTPSSGTPITIADDSPSIVGAIATLNPADWNGITSLTVSYQGTQTWRLGLDNMGFTAAVPKITSAAYDSSSGNLVVTGNVFEAKTGAANDVAVSNLTLTGEGGATYTLTTADVEIDSSTQFSVVLNSADKLRVDALLNKNGTSADSGMTYNLAAADDFIANLTAGNTADAVNGVTVSNYANPTIASSTYDASSGVLVVTGTGFSSISGGANDVVANTFTLTGEAGTTYTLTDSANVDVTSATAFTLSLSATDKLNVNGILNKNGLNAIGGQAYNLAAADNWLAGGATSANIADPTASVTASNVILSPEAPIIGTATAGDGQASVSFSAPASNGGAAITSYTLTSSPGGFTASGTSSPLTVTGLTNGVDYTFSVTATNSAGVGAASAISNSVTPIGSQTITFASPGTQFFGTTPSLTATASSGLAPSFTSATTSVCTITSGGMLTFVTTGSCTINADQAGNAAYLAAAQVSQTFDVNAVIADAPIIGSAIAGDAQAIVTFSAPANNGGSAITGYTVTSSPGGLTATGTSSPLTVTGLTNGTAYIFSVTATNSAGNSSSSSASNSVTPIGSQTITFSNPGAQNIGTSPTLTASASSGLAPSFTSSTTDVCTVTSAGTLTFVTTGSCTINADQAGNAAYSAAAQVSQTFDVNAVVAGAPVIGSATAGDAQASVSFTAPANNGGSAITSYTVTSSPDGLTATGTSSPLTVTGLTNGTAYSFSVTATNSAGTSSSSSASNSVTPIGSQTITFSNPGAQSIGTSPTLTASASSGLAPSFTSSTTDVCTVTSAGALTFVTTGSCTINADQAGNAAYLAAAQVSQTFDVNAVVAGAPSIGTATAGDTQASVSFTAPANNGGSAITSYTVTSSPDGLTATGTSSPLTVTGLTNGTAYSFSVTATNSAGNSASSSASNSVTPIGSQTITFSNPGAQNIGTSPTLTASASSGLAPSFTSSTTDVCTVTSAGVLSFVITGSCTINADQAGNAAYSAAAQVSQTFDVNAVVAGAPVIGSATAGDAQASVSFTAPANNGGSAITGYTVTSSPGGLTATGTSSPITVTGLTNGTAYTFSVTATNSAGTSSSSSASNSVTPSGAPVFTSTPILSVNQNEAYSYTLIASDTAEDVLTYSALTLPSWLSFNETTTSLTGVPSRDDVGSHSISLKVIDARGLSDIQSFTLVVNAVNSIPVADNANVSLDEDTSLSIIFTATDDDGDALTYEVVAQPSSGTFDKHGSAWLYTPNADFNGDDSVSFIAKDAESSSEPAVVSITVNPLNDEPMAVDDNYSLSLSDNSSYTMAVLDNDTDVDGDTLTIDGAAADVGSVQIVGSQLNYQAPTDFVGPVALRYTISDGQKGRSHAKVQLIITGENSADAPVITVPADITANATGLFTKLKLGVATAVDKAGNKLAVSLVNTQQLFAPGEHLAYWQATDSEGLSSIKTQKVTVNPLISISKNQLVAEGSEAQFTVYLNGPSPLYPVSIPYTVSGSSDDNDHDLIDGVFEITSGLSASFSVNVFDDGITEADEELIISLDPSLNLSNQRETRMLITEANIAPQASIAVTQSNERRTQVSKLEGKVYISAHSRDVNAQDSLTEEWSTGVLVLESDADGSYFDPSTLDAGSYPISLVVTDDGTPQLSTKVQLTILVKDSLPVLTGTDSDGDLIPDNQEGFADTDGDGIANYLDAINECNVLQELVSEQQTFLAESQSGVCLRLGNTALLNGGNGIKIPDDLLIKDPLADNLGGLFDFELTGIPKVGDSILVVIPQALPVPTNAVYRKFVRGSWQEFVTNANNEVMSSAGNAGYCPPPGAAEWQAGLTEGHWCVQLTIEDGGPNDDDGIANGTIVDPGGVAVMLNGNALPLAVADAVTVPVNQGIEIDVLANDSDADGDTLTVKQVISQFGTAEVLDNQQVSYLPAEDFIGTDVLVYSISDGNGGTASNKLTITVVANRAPIAVDDMASTDDKTALILDVLSNDTDADNHPLSVIAASAQQGSVMIENNKIRYTPTTGFDGVDTVSYTISDGEGGEATANVMVTVKAYQTQVVKNGSSGGSLHWFWSGLLLLVIMLRLKPQSGLRVYQVLSLGVVGLLVSPSSVQAQEPSLVSPWYLNAAVGVSETDNTQSELQMEITSGQIESFDKSGTSLGFRVGYQVTPVLAFELGYIDFGEGSTQISGESLDASQYHDLVKSVSPILPAGTTVGALFTLVEHEKWRFSVPVGVLFWESEVKSDSQGQTLTTQFDGTDWYTGMRVDYQFSRHWSAGLGMDYIALAPNDLLSYQANLRYQF
ncbi:Ig-like domain-containing protein [Shewanella sp.]|uniref:Ig-like domain-containing protein n=1 Tax=Shewanella sp. TaxID=50422 RepID=UPI004047926B